MTVSSGRGMICPATIRNDRPKNMIARIVAIVTIVWAALRDSGGLKAGIPFEIASVPVITADPTANARRSRNRLSVSVGGGRLAGGGTDRCPVKYRYSPPPTIANI